MEGRTELPTPSYRGTRTLEEALVKRHSNRSFLDRPIELAAVGQLLWAGQGMRDRIGGRTTPSASRRYPLDLYILTEAGLALYLPEGHALETVHPEDLREPLHRAVYFQESIKEAPLIVVITAEFARADHQYGAARAERFVLIETGHVAQNILLQAYAMGLAGVAFGAFKDKQVSEVLQLPPQRKPLYILSIGYSRS